MHFAVMHMQGASNRLSRRPPVAPSAARLAGPPSAGPVLGFSVGKSTRKALYGESAASNKKLNFTRKGILIPSKDSDEDEEVLERSADEVAAAAQRAAGDLTLTSTSLRSSNDHVVAADQDILCHSCCQVLWILVLTYGVLVQGAGQQKDCVITGEGAFPKACWGLQRSAKQVEDASDDIHRLQAQVDVLVKEQEEMQR